MLLRISGRNVYLGNRLAPIPRGIKTWLKTLAIGLVTVALLAAAAYFFDSPIPLAPIPLILIILHFLAPTCEHCKSRMWLVSPDGSHSCLVEMPVLSRAEVAAAPTPRNLINLKIRRLSAHFFLILAIELLVLAVIIKFLNVNFADDEIKILMVPGLIFAFGVYLTKVRLIALAAQCPSCRGDLSTQLAANRIFQDGGELLLNEEIKTKIRASGREVPKLYEIEPALSSLQMSGFWGGEEWPKMLHPKTKTCPHCGISMDKNLN